MSFFGLDALPAEGSKTEEYDLSNADAYDVLAQKLDEGNDELNDETFGDFNTSNLDKEFDFAGQTASVADTIDEEQFVFARANRSHQPSVVSAAAVSAAGRPASFAAAAAGPPGAAAGLSSAPSVQARNFQPIPGLWGASTAPQKPQQQQSQQDLSKDAKPHMLSVEELEAQMMASNKTPQQAQQAQQAMYYGGPPPGQFGFQQQQPGQQPSFPPGMGGFPPMAGQYGAAGPFPQDPAILNNPLAGYPGGQPFIQPQQQQQIPPGQVFPSQPLGQIVPQQDIQQIQQQPQAQLQQPLAAHDQQQPQAEQEQGQGIPPYSLNVSRNDVPSLAQVMMEDMSKNDVESDRLLKKSRRIAQQYKYNNLMTAYDKSLITRIQLNRIVTEDPFNEDFYYVVSSQIQARTNPMQPLNSFAKTYLFQRGNQRNGGFYFGGGGNGRYGRNRHQDNPLQRMHQQVQQAVQYARDHPQKEQITLEGALGKISLNTGKNPRQSLVLKKLTAKKTEKSTEETVEAAAAASKDSEASGAAQSSAGSSSAKGEQLIAPKDLRSLLILVEDVYSTLLEIESIERSKGQSQPGQQEEGTSIEDEGPAQESELSTESSTTDWDAKLNLQYQKLWDQLELVALEPEESRQTQVKTIGNPFIELLRHNKGKRLIPRIFRHLNLTQRLTILTRIVNHLDTLDVIREGAYVDGEDLKPQAKESVEIFLQTVLPPVVHLISESEFGVVIGLLEILLTSNDVVHVSRTKTGLSILTVLISQAEFISQDSNNSNGDGPSPAVDESDLATWKITFDALFQSLQGHLASLFPPRRVDDSYVWHFLASLALAASLDHQRVIVDEVREKIFGVMAEAKALPPEMGVQKITNLNLFLNVMGLNATTTEIGQMS